MTPIDATVPGLRGPGLTPEDKALVQDGVEAAERADDAATKAERSMTAASIGPATSDIALALGADEGGAAPAWFDGDGRLHAVLADGGSVIVLTGGVVSGIVDADGYVGQARDVTGAQVDRFSPFTVALVGDDVAVINATARALVTYGEGAQSAPSRSGDRVAWLDAAGAFHSVDASVRPDLVGMVRLWLLLVYGQSNSVGGDAMPGLDRLPLDPGRALMFSRGLVPSDASNEVPVADAALGRMIDLTGPIYDGNGAVGFRAAHGYLAALPADTALAVANSGVRGRAIAALTVGTVPFRNLIKTIVRAKLQAWAAGVPFAVPAIVYVQGESDFATATVDGYAAALVTLRNGVRDATRAITGDNAADPPMLIVQPSSWTVSNLATSAVPLAQMKAMITDATRFAVIGPMYHLPHEPTSPLHLTSEGNRRLDEMCGDALARLARGAGAAGLYATGAVRNGTAVTVTCRLPEGGALAIDTASVTDPGQMGLVYRQADGSAVAISNIAVNGDKITFTLASAVAGTLGFALEGTAGAKAGPTSGPRCPIRDQFGAISADGQPRFNWMLEHSIAVA